MCYNRRMTSPIKAIIFDFGNVTVETAGEQEHRGPGNQARGMVERWALECFEQEPRPAQRGQHDEMGRMARQAQHMTLNYLNHLVGMPPRPPLDPYGGGAPPVETFEPTTTTQA